MKEIQLTKGKIALVDDADYEWLNQWKWYASKSNDGYVAKRDVRKGNKCTRFLMHRVIMGVTDPNTQVDHINFLTHDNRRENLRVCTPLQNSRHRRNRKNSNSKYKGVYWMEGGWAAAIKTVDSKEFLGFYETEIDAALAYDRAAEIYHKEFAHLNFPKDKTAPQRIRIKKDNPTGYRGVFRMGKKFFAQTKINRKSIYLGVYETPEEAAMAYNKKALELLGEKASLNII